MISCTLRVICFYVSSFCMWFGLLFTCSRMCSISHNNSFPFCSWLLYNHHKSSPICSGSVGKLHRLIPTYPLSFTWYYGQLSPPEVPWWGSVTVWHEGTLSHCGTLWANNNITPLSVLAYCNHCFRKKTSSSWHVRSSFSCHFIVTDILLLFHWPAPLIIAHYITSNYIYPNQFHMFHILCYI